jgi:hypothetical protein
MIPSSPKSHHRPIQNTLHLMKTSRRCGANRIRSVRPIGGGDIDCYPDLRSSQQHHGDPLMYQHNRIMNNSNSNSNNNNNNNNNTSDCSHRDTTSLLRFSSSSAITTGSTTVTKNKVHNKPQRQSSSNNNKIYVRIKRRAEHRKTTTTTTTTTTALNNEKLADIVGDNDADIDIGDDDTGHPYKSLYPTTAILNNNNDLIDVGVDDTDHPYKSLYPTSTIMNGSDDDLFSGLVVGVQCEPADDDDVAIAEEKYHSSLTIATDQMANMTRNLLLAMDDDNDTIGGIGGGPLSWKNVSLLHPPPDSFVLYLTNILCKHVQEYLKIYPSRCYWVKYTDFWNTLFWKTLHHFNYDGEEECSGSIASSKIMLSYRNYIQTLYTNFLKHFNSIDLIEYRIGTNNQVIFLRACILFGANTQHQRQHQH